jgi:chemotaxis protein histidine kinase CheA
MGAMRRAEAALDTLKSNFSDWIADDVKSLLTVRARYAQTPDAESRAALMRAAHDIKGQAATFNYPLIARVAASLAKLISALPQNQIVPQGLVDAHVDAIQVIHRTQTGEDKIALTLCAELDKRVEETLTPTKKK